MVWVWSAVINNKQEEETSPTRRTPTVLGVHLRMGVFFGEETRVERGANSFPVFQWQ